MSVKSLGYVVIEARDLAAWTQFATQVLGLQLAANSTADQAFFRMDERPFRVLVRQGEADRFVASGWEFASRQAFDAALARLQAAGVAVEPAAADETKARCALGLARCQDPSGNALELYYGRLYDYAPFASPVGVGGFVTGDMGLGHVVVSAMQLEETRAFYVELLGFGDSDQARFQLSPEPGAPELGFYFLHCDNPRHHSLAMGNMPAPSGLVHMMIEVKDLDEVGRGLDRAQQAGVHISSSLGRHANDKMVSFYMRSPGGFDIEYGCDGWRVDWSTFTPTFSINDSIWGHHWSPPPAE